MLSKLFKAISKPMGYDLPSYCQIASVFDRETFILHDSSLMSFIELKGVKNLPGDEQSRGVFSALNTVLQTNLERKGHSFQVIFESDPDSILSDLKDATSSVRNTVDRLRLDFLDLYDDWQKAIATHCQTEKCWLIVYTTPMILQKETLNNVSKNRKIYERANSIPALGNNDNPIRLIKEITNPHRSLCNRIIDECSAFNYDLGIVDVETALWHLKYSIDSKNLSPDWKPSLWLNQKFPKGRIASDEEDSNFWIRGIGEQLFSKDVFVERSPDYQGDFIKSDGRCVSTFAISECPENPEEFSTLFARVDSDIPFRIVFDIRPGGIQAKMMLKIYSSIFGWMGNTNRKIKEGFDYLEEKEKSGDKIISFRILVSTWADTPEELSRRESVLIRAVQSWGLCQVISSMGDPVDTWAATLPGLTRNFPAEITAAPLSEIISLLPLQRPSSAWGQGSMITRTLDGKLMPLQPMSNLQDTWNELYYAPPGSGKSVLLNTTSLAMVLSPGLTSLPRIAHLDVGPSASGLIYAIQAALPPERRHEAQYIKVEMSQAFAMNPFDTQLGCRKPTQIERDFLINLLSVFATPAGQPDPYAMAAELAGLMIDEVYKRFSDKADPKLYESHVNEKVDSVLAEYNFEVDPDNPPSWWKVVDFLFSKGRIYEAGEAQKYAVPILEDLIMISKTQVIRDLFSRSESSTVRVSNGQTLLDMYGTVISTAKREYPVLAGVTKFDVSDARIVVLDLNNVARGTGPEGRRRAALMYMLGRQATTKSFYLTKEMLSTSPAIYHQYHNARIDSIKEEKKAIIYDEFHNTGGMQALRKQVITDMREGRKWNIRVALSSQLLGDFDDDMVGVSTAIYILKAGTQDDINEAVRRFSLSKQAEVVMLKQLKGPKSWGAPFLGYFQTKNGRYSQLLVNTIGPVLQWALTTTAEDMALRGKLYEVIPPDEARKLLAYVYDRGSCIEDLKRLQAKQDVDDLESPIAKIANDLLDYYYSDEYKTKRSSARKSRVSI